MQQASLDTAQTWPICAANGFLALFDMRATQPRAVTVVANAHLAQLQTLASEVRTIFWALHATKGGVLILVVSTRYIVLIHAGLGCALIGTSTLNVALALLQFRNAPTKISLARGVARHTKFDSQGKNTLWALAMRVDRTEMARKFSVEADNQTFSFDVACGKMGAGLRPTTLQTLGAALTASKTRPRYAIAATLALSAPNGLGATDIVRAAPQGPIMPDASLTWAFDRDGWPCIFPATTSLGRLSALAKTAQSMRRWAENVTKISVSQLGNGCTPLLTLRYQDGRLLIQD